MFLRTAISMKAEAHMKTALCLLRLPAFRAFRLPKGTLEIIRNPAAVTRRAMRTGGRWMPATTKETSRWPPAGMGKPWKEPSTWWTLNLASLSAPQRAKKAATRAPVTPKKPLR